MLVMIARLQCGRNTVTSVWTRSPYLFSIQLYQYDSSVICCFSMLPISWQRKSVSILCRRVGIPRDDEQAPRQQHAEAERASLRDAGRRLRQLVVLLTRAVRCQRAL